MDTENVMQNITIDKINLKYSVKNKVNKMIVKIITTLVITPSFLTLAGGYNQMGVMKDNWPTSISLSVPIGILLVENVTFSKFTTLKLVQST